MRYALFALLLTACAPTLSGDDDDSTPPSDALESGAATLSITLVEEDGSEETVDVEESGYGLWFCGEDCFSLNISFDAFDTRLSTGWSFVADDPPEAGSGDIYYANIRWDDDSLFGRQGEHPNVAGAWGDPPGGDVVIDSSCADCSDGGPASSGSLSGVSTVTVYDSATEQPNGQTLRLDALVFRDLPLVY
jgi:hypothetical protein